MTSDPLSVFVSYNKDDQQWAEWIAWQIEAVGHKAIIQAWDFGAGSNFVLEMQQATKDADRTIAVLSPSYLAAEFTHPEWAAAFRQDPRGEEQRLVPVRVKPCAPDSLLGTIVYEDLVGVEDADEARDKLLTAVLSQRRKPDTEPIFPGGSAAAAIYPPAAKGQSVASTIEDVIGGLHNLLVPLRRELESLTGIQAVGADPIEEKIVRSSEAYLAAQEYFELHRFYLDSDLVKQLDEVLSVMRNALVNAEMGYMGPKRPGGRAWAAQHSEYIGSASRAVRNELPPLIEAIEAAFRECLGIEKRKVTSARTSTRGEVHSERSKAPVTVAWDDSVIQGDHIAIRILNHQAEEMSGLLLLVTGLALWDEKTGDYLRGTHAKETVYLNGPRRPIPPVRLAADSGQPEERNFRNAVTALGIGFRLNSHSSAYPEVEVQSNRGIWRVTIKLTLGEVELEDHHLWFSYDSDREPKLVVAEDPASAVQGRDPGLRDPVDV